jgi:hypothetical protein
MRHGLVGRSDARRPLGVDYCVLSLASEVDAVVGSVLLGDCDEPGVWAGCAGNIRRTFKRRKASA